MTYAELVLPPVTVDNGPAIGTTPVAPASPESSIATPAAPGEPLVTLKNVNKRYGDKASARDALKDVSLSVRQGEIFGIIGRSGAGKSTLVRTINRLEDISSGHLEVDGKQVSQLNEAELIALRRRVGMVFQHFNLLSAKTVAQNIGLPLLVAGVPKREIDSRVDELLRLVGLSDKRDAHPSQLSGGQKQRVGIARALVHNPRLLLCDEATSALDPETTQSILALLRDINRRLGLTIILITHEFDVVREICDRVAVMDKGEIIESGEVWRVFGDPQHEVTAALLTPELLAIPAELKAKLLSAPPPTHYRSVVSVRYRGNSSGAVDLSALTTSAGQGVQLLHASVQNVHGYLYGRLLLSVPGEFDHTAPASPHTSHANLIARLQDLDPVTETLGYVTHPDR